MRIQKNKKSLKKEYLEKAVRSYLTIATSVDEFTLEQRLLMRAAFIHGAEWQKNQIKKK